ncbi:PglL family O-oligosaccharyltransferase [Chromobacterium haemolyticum]|uniref:PglL family O-oligosaccharyltransferase n=1 Tax=Chromobacterium haemolyticum TaxID=394935 RepID=UPI00030C3BD3|nr:Wzy polymerase domain-containing protein [Chromobacterium haemolyticum]
MIKKTSILFPCLLFLAIILPFFSFARFYPLPDWISSAVALTFLSLCLVCALIDNARMYLSPVTGCVFTFAILSVVQNRFDSLAIGLIFFLIFLVMLCVPFYFEKNRSSLFYMLSSFILAGALLQACLGWIQLLGLAREMYGLVLFDMNNPVGNVMGNVGQRNQYAHFLMWGCLSACYLRAVGRLHSIVFFISIAVLALLISWSGARLPLAYGLGVVLLAWLWLRRNGEDFYVRRMTMAIVFAIFVIILTQLLSPEIVELLKFIGVDINAHSGVERILEGGLGARRRVEWAKAWDVFMANPMFGVGLGGYAAESVWAETFSGFPKVPESWLFTNSHNLIFQLLAETGLVGTVIVFVGMLLGVLPYFKRGEQSAESLLLISIFSMILIHSLLEYPLWYLPFLIMLLVIFSFSPILKFELMVGPIVKRSILVLAIALCWTYLATSMPVFLGIVKYSRPAPLGGERLVAVKVLNSASRHPLWTWDADMALANYLQPSRAELPLKLALFERLAGYRPYPNILIKLAVLRALNGDSSGAKQGLEMAIANYPEYVAEFVVALRMHSEPEAQPLREMTEAAGRAYAKYPAHSEEAQRAAVMTVASPVTRKPLF